MLHEFTASVTETGTGGFTARLFPFGEKVKYGRGTVQFQPGEVSVPSTVPLTLDHGDSVRDRVGVLSRYFEDSTAAYGEFEFADTEAGRDMRELMRVGAVTDVSVGVEHTGEAGRDITMAGSLDHASIVSRGRFGKAERPSKALSVHDDKEPQMADTNEAPAPVVAEFDDTELRAQIVKLSDEITELKDTRVVDEPALFSSAGDYIRTQLLAADGDVEAGDRMAKFALATDTTTAAAGVVPDFLSSEYLSIIDTTRAFVGNIPSDPIGSAGMSVVYPKHTSGPSVAVQASEHTEVSSTALVIGTTTVDLNTYAGANSVSLQLIRRSQPGFVDILYRELASQYASVTDAASIATAVGVAGGTAILADLGADGAATFAAFSTASAAIQVAMRAPADTIFLASDRWAELNSLADTDGRPILVYGANGPMNAAGQSAFNTSVAQYHGWTVRLDPDAAAGTCLVANSSAVANLEQNPVNLEATQVSTLAVDIGIWGMQALAVKFVDGLYTLTTA